MVMSFFRKNKAPINSSPNDSNAQKLGFLSTGALERGLDGSDSSFEEYFFALYHCSPDEVAEINDRRKQLRDEYPEKSTSIGRVIPPFLAPVRSRGQATRASFCLGVMPPIAIFGRS